MLISLESIIKKYNPKKLNPGTLDFDLLIDNLIKELNTSDLAKSQKFSANVQEIKVGN